MAENEADPLLDIGKLLQINELDLESELASCPSLYYTFSKLACEAEDIYEAATLKLEIYETQLTKTIKGQNTGITQTDIKRYFRENPEWQNLRKEQLELEKNYKILEKSTKAFDMKSHMLASINRRDLYKRSVRFKDND